MYEEPIVYSPPSKELNNIIAMACRRDEITLISKGNIIVNCKIRHKYSSQKLRASGLSRIQVVEYSAQCSHIISPSIHIWGMGSKFGYLVLLPLIYIDGYEYRT